MIIETLVVGMIQANCYIIGDESTKKAVVVDPGGDVPVIVSALKARDLEPVAIFATHGHFDHIEGMGELKDAIDVPIWAHKDEMVLIRGMAAQGQLFGMNVKSAPEPDKFFEDGDEVEIGNLKITVLHTPGHSPGSVSFLVNGHLLTGDLLFSGSIGRTDLHGGSYDTLISSVREKVFTLPGETIVHPGHGPSTTVAIEQRSNPFFR